MRWWIWALLPVTVLGCRVSEPESPGRAVCTGVECHLTSLLSCFDPAWSPDGTRVLFLHTPITGTHRDPQDGRCVFDVDRANAGTWEVRSDGSRMSRVLEEFLSDADWSHQGWIAFGGQSGGLFRVYAGDYGIEWMSLRQITDVGWEPRWSPDGKRIAFVDYRRGSFVVEVAGGSPRFLGHYLSPDWSPEGDRLVCYHDGELALIDTTGTIVDSLGVKSEHARWSPAGGTIAYTYHEPGDGARLWVFDLGTRTARQLCDERTYSSFGFDWDPSGSRIVFIRYRRGIQSPDDGTLWTVDVKTGRARPLVYAGCLWLD